MCGVPNENLLKVLPTILSILHKLHQYSSKSYQYGYTLFILISLFKTCNIFSLSLYYSVLLASITSSPLTFTPASP